MYIKLLIIIIRIYEKVERKVLKSQAGCSDIFARSAIFGESVILCNENFRFPRFLILASYPRQLGAMDAV